MLLRVRLFPHLMRMSPEGEEDLIGRLRPSEWQKYEKNDFPFPQAHKSFIIAKELRQIS